MITADRMAAVDENAAALGVPRKQLMESSGNAVAREVRAALAERTADGDGAGPPAVVVLAGRGNNGGDGLVAARFLDDTDVCVRLLGRPESIRTDIARENYDALVAGESDVRTVTDPGVVAAAVADPDPDVVVDAMLGTGVSGVVREPVASAAAAVNAADATVVAVDVPSGVDPDTGAVADGAVDPAAVDRVVTFHDAKPVHADLDATVTVADIGIPAAAETLVGPGDLRGLERVPASHKGDHGEVLVVGGGPYAGAPALTAAAALRTGGDLARVAVPARVAAAVQGYSENLIVRELDADRDVGRDRFVPAHVDDVAARAAAHDVTVVGPGLGDAAATRDAVAALLERLDGVVVVDADALAAVPTVDTDATLICTPHAGELRAMGGPDVTDLDAHARADALASFVPDLPGDVTVLLKGAHDAISDGETTRRNRTGNPGMTVGGTGDVLAGATAALAARLDPLAAASVGAYVNGLAGDRVRDERGDGLTATDLLDALPGVIARD
jgi:NAD(P)H-hydrate epimerase